MDMRDKLKELNMTEDEIKRLTKAMKDEKFKELLHDYAREISDPENKRKYEEEITLMEQERGNKVDFIHPTPFRALRTSVDGKLKCYINICSNEKVAKPAWRSGTSPEGRRGQSWSLPYSLHPGRRDADAKGNAVSIYDVVFHPDTLHMASRNQRFMDMVESTAVQGIQDSFGVKLDVKNVRTMRTKYKGVPQPCIIRNPIPGFTPRDPSEDPFPFKYPDDPPPPTKERKPTSLQTDPEEVKEPTRPHHTVKYRSFIDLQDFRYARDSATTPRPKEIVVTVDLPLLRSVADANLEVKQKSLLLESERPSYRLALELAYPVDQEKGQAKFNRQRGQLTVTLPVLPSQEASEFAARVLCAGGGGVHEGEQGRDSAGGEEHLNKDDEAEDEQMRKQAEWMKDGRLKQELVEDEAEGQKKDLGEQFKEEEAEGLNSEVVHEEEVEDQSCDQIHQHVVEDQDKGPEKKLLESEEAEGHDSNQIHEEIVEEAAEDQTPVEQIEDEAPKNDQIHEQSEEEEAEGPTRDQIHQHVVDEDEGPKKKLLESEMAEGHDSNQIHEEMVERAAEEQTRVEQIEDDKGPKNDQMHEKSEEEEAEGPTRDQLHQHVVEEDVEDQTSDGRTLEKGEQGQERMEHTKKVSMQPNEDEERAGNDLDEPLRGTVHHAQPPTAGGSQDLMVDSPGGGGDGRVEPTRLVEARQKVETDAGPLHGGTGERSPTPSAEKTGDSKEDSRMDGRDLPTALTVHHPEPPQRPPEEPPEEPPLVVLREVDRDGNMTVISDHRTSAGFIFQNSLVDQLD